MGFLCRMLPVSLCSLVVFLSIATDDQLLVYAQTTERKNFDLQAHRGGLGLSVENTLGTFANALQLGVSTLELDIQVTEDRVAVVTHDRQVQPHKCQDTAPVFTDDPEFPYVGDFVKNLTLEQLHTLDCGSQRLDGHPWQRLLPGATMPTLKQVLDLVNLYQADVALNIETKVEAGAPHETAPREQFVTLVIAELENAGLMEQATIQSFDWGTLMLAKQLAPRLPVVALSNGQQFLRCGESGTSPWTGGIDLDDFDCDLVQAAASFGADAVSPVHGTPQEGRYGDPGYVPFVTQAMVDAAHARQMRIIPWTVDDRATAEYLMDLGVDGLITDYPDQLRKLLAERGWQLPVDYPPLDNCAASIPAGLSNQLCRLSIRNRPDD